MEVLGWNPHELYKKSVQNQIVCLQFLLKMSGQKGRTENTKLFIRRICLLYVFVIKFHHLLCQKLFEEQEVSAHLTNIYQILSISCLLNTAKTDMLNLV